MPIQDALLLLLLLGARSAACALAEAGAHHAEDCPARLATESRWAANSTTTDADCGAPQLGGAARPPPARPQAYGEAEPLYERLAAHERPPADLHEPAAWRLIYIDEQTDPARVLVQEDSLDTRLANVIHAGNSIRFANTDMLRVHQGDERANRAFERRMAGARVDDTKCGRQLERMLAIQRDLEALVGERRASAQALGGAPGPKRQHRRLEARHVQLARMLDASGHYDSGLLLGKQVFQGHSDLCTRSLIDEWSPDEGSLAGGAPAPAHKEEPIRGRMCYAKFDLRHQVAVGLAARVHDPHEPETMITAALCVPDTCHAQSYHKHARLFQALAGSQFKLPAGLYVNSSLPLAGIYCPADSDSAYARLPPSAWLLLSVAGLWLGLVLWATRRRMRRGLAPVAATPPSPSAQAHQNGQNNPNNQNGLVHQNGAAQRPHHTDGRQNTGWLAFVRESICLQESLADLLGTDEREERPARKEARRIELAMLSPIKVVACAAVVLGHVVLISLASTNDAVFQYRYSESSGFRMFFVNFTLIVDTFYVISGIFTAYFTLSRFRAELGLADSAAKTTSGGGDARAAIAQRPSQPSLVGRVKLYARLCGGVFLTRYTRLIPVLYLMFWMKKSLFIRQMRYDFFDNGANRDTESGACLDEGWLQPLLLTSSNLPLARQCIPQGWSVSNDVIYSLIAGPFCLLVLLKRPVYALGLAALASLASCYSMIFQFRSVEPYIHEAIRNARVHGFSLIFSIQSHSYTGFQYRAFSMIVGLIAGYFLDQYRQNTHLRQWPAWLRGPATKAALYFSAFVLIIGPASLGLLRDNLCTIFPFQYYLSEHLFTTLRLGWAITNAILCLRLVTDFSQRAAWRNFMCARFWQTLFRLNFVTLLIHIDLILMDVQLTTLSNLSAWRCWSLFLTAYSNSLLISLLVYVLFEYPLSALVKGAILGLPKRFRAPQHPHKSPAQASRESALDYQAKIKTS